MAVESFEGWPAVELHVICVTQEFLYICEAGIFMYGANLTSHDRF